MKNVFRKYIFIGGRKVFTSVFHADTKWSEYTKKNILTVRTVSHFGANFFQVRC